MKLFVSRVFRSLLGLALLTVPAASVAAQAKPVLVVSLSGVDEILGDVGFLTQLAGSAPVGQMAAMMANQYVQGLDRKKSITIVVNSEEGELKPMGIIPVTDLPRFLEGVAQGLGEVQEAGDGVYELNARGVPTYIKEKGGWAFIGQSVNALNDLPDDPAAIAGELATDYDIGIRAHIKNLPDMYKQLALTQIKQGVAQQLESAGEIGNQEAQLQQTLIKANIEQWEAMMNEIDTITLGWLVDRDTQKTYIDGVTTAIPGTKMAKQMASLRDMKSNFAGFVVPGAAATVHAVGEMTEADIEQTVSMLRPLRDTAKNEIDEDNDLPDDEARAVAKDLIDQLFTVLEDTIREGKFDMGAAMMLDNRTMSVLVGLGVADGTKVEQSIRDLAEIAKKDPNFPGINFDAAKDGPVRFHTMQIPVPEDEDARDVFGATMDVVVGIGEKATYFGFGNECLNGLRKAISTSASNTGNSPPMTMNVALGPILEFASNFEDNPMVAALAGTLKENKGSDNIVITSTPIPNGARYRLEVQEGVLKSIGQATMVGVAQ